MWSTNWDQLTTSIVLNDSTMIPKTTTVSRLIDVQTNRFGGDILGLGCDWAESFICQYFSAWAFILFLEKVESNTEFVTIQGINKTCNMTGNGIELRY